MIDPFISRKKSVQEIRRRMSMMVFDLEGLKIKRLRKREATREAHFLMGEK